MSIEKIKVNGKIFDIRDVEDVKAEETRAKAAEKALKERLQGVNVSTDSRFDPFRWLGPQGDEGYSSWEEFNSVLNSLIYDREVAGYNSGYFRCRARWRDVEIRNTILSTANQNIVQAVSGAIKVENNAIVADNSGAFRILYRQHLENSWGEWKQM